MDEGADSHYGRNLSGKSMLDLLRTVVATRTLAVLSPLHFFNDRGDSCPPIAGWAVNIGVRIRRGSNMKAFVGGLAAVLSAASFAAPTQDEEAANAYAYYVSVTAPRVAKACEKSFPGYQKEFDPAYAAWQKANGASITTGKTALMERDKKGEKNLEQIEQNSESGAKAFASATEQNQREICNKNMRALAPE